MLQLEKKKTVRELEFSVMRVFKKLKNKASFEP